MDHKQTISTNPWIEWVQERNKDNESKVPSNVLPTKSPSLPHSSRCTITNIGKDPYSTSDKDDLLASVPVLTKGNQLKSQTKITKTTLSIIPTSVIMKSAIARKQQEQLESEMQRLKLAYQEYFNDGRCAKDIIQKQLEEIIKNNLKNNLKNNHLSNQEPSHK